MPHSSINYCTMHVCTVTRNSVRVNLVWADQIPHHCWMGYLIWGTKLPGEYGPTPGNMVLATNLLLGFVFEIYLPALLCMRYPISLGATNSIYEGKSGTKMHLDMATTRNFVWTIFPGPDHDIFPLYWGIRSGGLWTKFPSRPNFPLQHN